MSAPEEIAIVGVGCRFPGADDVTEFWRVLSKGENHVIEVPKSRWNVDAFYDPDPDKPGKTYVRHAGFVNGIDEWDNHLFGISRTEAELIDPQQRMVLDCVHMALEDGGITKTDIKGSKTGVFVGQMTFDYCSQLLDYDSITSAYTVTGTNPSITSARVSYVYNLSGPAMTVDTACSSSLVAIDLGCDAIRSGSCTAAICGGVNAMLNPQMFIAISKARMLSPGGQCKTFTQDADGYARGEGCGIVILKRLSDAVRDGNKIWATVRTGTNQDGHSVTPITAPSSKRQHELLKHVYHQHHVDKSRVQVIEAHGTGTAIGDPTESKALGGFFGEPATKDIHIGSVKTNIGHLEAAAGVAGLIKVLLMMKHGQVVPSLWYTKDNENPKLNLGRYRFVVPTECKPWPVKGIEPRIASVNSFGFGGTNAHAIVEQYSSNNFQNMINGTQVLEADMIPIVAISAFENEMLVKSVKEFCEHIEDKDYDIDALSHTSTCRRDHRPKRVAFVAASKAELVDQCKQYIVEKPVGVGHHYEDKNIVFVFCGVGTVWQGMCHWLLKNHVFRETIDRIDSLLVPMSGWSIKDKLLADESIGIDPMVDHVAIFACQVGLVEMWKEFGVKPDSVIGQSVGEVAAAWASGHIDLNYAVRVIYYRSKLLAEVREGKMAVVRHTDVQLVEKYCKTQNDVSIAVYNSPVSCTVSGNAESLIEMKDYLSDETKGQSKFTILDVRCGYHSKYVADAAEHISKLVGSTDHTEKTCPIYSTVTGRLETNGVYGTSSYWERNVRSPVQFASAVRESRQPSKENIYLEVGPSPVLSAHMDDICPADDSVTIIASIQRRHEAEGVTRAICSLYEHGLDLKWDAISPMRGSITDVPKYHFHKVKSLFESAGTLQTLQDGTHSSTALHPYINLLPYEDDEVAFQAEITEHKTSFVYDHIIHGKIILPGAFYAEIGYLAGETILKCNQEHVSVSMEFLRPVNLVRSHDTSLHITTHKLNKAVEFHAQHRNTTVCRGVVQEIADEVETMETNIEAIKLTVTMSPHQEMTRDAIYDCLQAKGFGYEGYFRLMSHVITNGSELIAEVDIPTPVMKESESLRFHPCILDVMMQTVVMLLNEGVLKEIWEDSMTFLPAGLENIRWYRKPERHMVLYTKRVSEMLLDTVFQLHFHILLLDHHGNRIAEIENMMTFASRKGAHAPLELTYKLTWQPLIMHPKTRQTQPNQPNILLLSDAPQTEMESIFGTNKNVNLFTERTLSVSCQDHVQEVFETSGLVETGNRKFDAIVYYVNPLKMQVDLNSEDAQSMYGTIADNCVFLAELVKRIISSHLDIPLYVVTENTQPNFKHRTSPVNVVGSEVWGFARSIPFEMLYSGLTLVDLQPSLSKGTKSRLLDFIERTCQNISEFPSEFILHEDTVWYSRFDKMDRCTQVQLAREMVTCPRPIHGLHNVIQNESTSPCFEGVCLTPATTLPDTTKAHSPTVRIQVKSIVMPPANIHQHTELLMPPANIHQHTELLMPPPENTHQHTDLLSPTQNDTAFKLLGPGLPVFAVEFTGYVVQGKRKSTPTCGGNADCDTINDVTERWEQIVVWPTTIQSEMLVPRSLVFNMKDIPFYQPGLLLYSLLFWSMVELVPRKASVVLYSHDPHGIAYRLLHAMLFDIKHASVRAIEDTDTTTRDTDVLVTMETLTDRHDMLWSSRRIVCLPGHLSLEATAALQATRARISTINLHDVLSEKNITKTLPRIVKWLKRNKKQVVEIMKSQCNVVQERSGVIQIPCHTVDITDTNGHSSLPTRKPLQQMFRKSEVYVVTGGLTGLGWELTTRMAEMGAGIIATVARTKPTQNMMENIDKLQSKSGCRIVCLEADVNDIVAVRKAFTELMLVTGNTPIKGIFHGAGVLKDKLLMDVTRSDIEFVLKPKVLGTLNLHVVCRELDLPLDYFVVASSVSSIIGSPGQSNYGAANTFMDTLMSWRRDHGLAGQSINWGALAVGMAANPKFVKAFVEKGFNLVPTPEITCCFQQALLQNDTCIVYADINWDLVAKYFTTSVLKRILPQFTTVISEAASTAALGQEQENIDFDVEALRKADHGTQMETLTNVCLAVATKVIGRDIEHLDVNDSLAQLSFDSMSTITFTNVLQRLTGYRMPAMFLLDSSRTLRDIGEHLHKHLLTDLVQTQL